MHSFIFTTIMQIDTVKQLLKLIRHCLPVPTVLTLHCIEYIASALIKLSRSVLVLCFFTSAVALKMAKLKYNVNWHHLISVETFLDTESRKKRTICLLASFAKRRHSLYSSEVIGPHAYADMESY